VFPTTTPTRDASPTTVHVLGLVNGVPAGPCSSTLSTRNLVCGRATGSPCCRSAGPGSGALVRFAVATAGRRGGTRMVAQIQPANVRFFRALGWTVLGAPADYLGVLHQQMSTSWCRERPRRVNDAGSSRRRPGGRRRRTPPRPGAPDGAVDESERLGRGPRPRAWTHASAWSGGQARKGVAGKHPNQSASVTPRGLVPGRIDGDPESARLSSMASEADGTMLRRQPPRRRERGSATAARRPAVPRSSNDGKKEVGAHGASTQHRDEHVTDLRMPGRDSVARPMPNADSPIPRRRA
jgi:hypothetical protein